MFFQFFLKAAIGNATWKKRLEDEETRLATQAIEAYTNAVVNNHYDQFWMHHFFLPNFLAHKTKLDTQTPPSHTTRAIDHPLMPSIFPAMAALAVLVSHASGSFGFNVGSSVSGTVGFLSLQAVAIAVACWDPSTALAIPCLSACCSCNFVSLSPSLPLSLPAALAIS